MNYFLFIIFLFFCHPLFMVIRNSIEKYYAQYGFYIPDIKPVIFILKDFLMPGLWPCCRFS